MNIYSALYNGFHPLDKFFPDYECQVVDTPDELDEPGFLIIHGGSDISPSLYNKEVSSYTYASDKPSRRDAQEWALLQAAKERGIVVFGICRGAQMLCAAAGGYLIQDVTGHSDDHTIKTINGDIIEVNSIHHQMQYPFDVDHTLLAWSSRRISSHYVDVDNKVMVPKEPEAVYYPNLGVGFQWHPEMMSANSSANQWIHKTLQDFYGN